MLFSKAVLGGLVLGFFGTSSVIVTGFATPLTSRPFYHQKSTFPISISKTIIYSTTVNGSEIASADLSVDIKAPPKIRLNLNEKARTVTSVCTSGTLSTISNHEGIEGSPFGSFVDYILDDEGNPVFLMNEMSMHTLNIERNCLNQDDYASGNTMVTLFTQLNSVKGPDRGQDISRCSVTGNVEKLVPGVNFPDIDTIKMRYSIAHTYADRVMESPKFSFYRLRPNKIYFVGGFGVTAAWVDPEEYKVAEPDILARESEEMINKLNRDNKEDLFLTSIYLLELGEKVEDTVVSSVDKFGMDIRVTRKGPRINKFVTDEFRLGFRIPVLSVEDAKSEIIKIFQEAWEKGQGYIYDDGELPGVDIPIIKIAEDSLS